MIRGEYLSDLSGSAWRKKLDASLEAVGLNPPDVLNKYPHQLSGGQLQRLLIARALLLEIKFLVADEIISMLDASTRIDVLNLLAELKGRGLGVLFITHDLSLGNYISERTLILRRGAVVEMGATEKVFGNPLHQYTKMLLSSVPKLHARWQSVEAEGEDRKEKLFAAAEEAELERGLVSDADFAAGGEAATLVEVEDNHFVASSSLEQR